MVNKGSFLQFFFIQATTSEYKLHTGLFIELVQMNLVRLYSVNSCFNRIINRVVEFRCTWEIVGKLRELAFI